MGACLIGSTGTNRKLYLGSGGFCDADDDVGGGVVGVSLRLPDDVRPGGVFGFSGVVAINGNMVVDAASVAVDEKLLHLVIIHNRNSLCR